jgi:hypothetical protein
MEREWGKIPRQVRYYSSTLQMKINATYNLMFPAVFLGALIFVKTFLSK